MKVLYQHNKKSIYKNYMYPCVRYLYNITYCASYNKSLYFIIIGIIILALITSHTKKGRPVIRCVNCCVRVNTVLYGC